MEWNGEIMRKKFFSSFVVFALVLSLTFGSTSKAYAMGGGLGEIILGSGVVIATEEAIAYVLLACGLTAGADAIYRNQAELKAWTNNRVEDIKKFGNSAIEFGSDVVAGLDDWFTDVANGIMDTGSKCWDMIKGWAGTVYASLANAGDVITSWGPNVTSKPTGQYASGSPCYSVKIEANQMAYEVYIGAMSDYVISVNSKGQFIAYSLEPMWYNWATYSTNPSYNYNNLTSIVPANVGFYNGTRYYYCSVGIGPVPTFGPQSVEDYFSGNGVVAGNGDITTVGGLNDALEKGGMSMDDYDLLTKAGAGSLTGAGTIGLEWQQLMDRDNVKVDENTGVISGSIADSLAGVATGEMSWSDAIDKVGAIPVIGDNVLDDAGVTDKPRPSTPEKPSVDGNYIFDLRNIFPFCLPFDMVDFLGCLCAPAETPKFTIEIPSLDSDMSVKWHKLELDFSQFNQVAVWVRNMELLAFIVGLAMITRSKMIRG